VSQVEVIFPAVQKVTRGHRQTDWQNDRLSDRHCLYTKWIFLFCRLRDLPTYVMFTTDNYSVSTVTLSPQNFGQLQSCSSY